LLTFHAGLIFHDFAFTPHGSYTLYIAKTINFNSYFYIFSIIFLFIKIQKLLLLRKKRVTVKRCSKNQKQKINKLNMQIYNMIFMKWKERELCFVFFNHDDCSINMYMFVLYTLLFWYTCISFIFFFLYTHILIFYILHLTNKYYYIILGLNNIIIVIKCLLNWYDNKWNSFDI